LVGSGILGWVVDKYHLYKSMILISFVGSMVSLIFFALLSYQSNPSSQPGAMAASILMTGFFVTPILPISIETAVEVCYPVPESSTAAMQQVCSSLCLSVSLCCGRLYLSCLPGARCCGVVSVPVCVSCR
jgi:hypothetical protein